MITRTFTEDEVDDSDLYQVHFRNSEEYKNWHDNTSLLFKPAFIKFFKRFLNENNIKILDISIDESSIMTWHYIFTFEDEKSALIFNLKYGL
jgi:exosome complex RNA-binding protein Rrp42 (RNase PH superfamily)